MNRTKDILEKLDELIPNPRCELEYTKPYELLIATVLSAQCTDARVNQVTKVLWQKYILHFSDELWQRQFQTRQNAKSQ